MKKLLILLLLTFSVFSCKSQSREFSLIGKWVCVEEAGSDGAKKYSSKIENGDVLIFDAGNKVSDKKCRSGFYDLVGDRLHIKIPNNKQFYILNKNKYDFDKLSLIPVTSEYQFVCDEGCEYFYEKATK